MPGKFNIYNFGAWLKSEMIEQGISNKELAHKAGVSEQALCMYKRCYRFPTFETLDAILEALGYAIIVKKAEAN